MVFISYSSIDKEKAYALKSVLIANKIECWMAPESIPSGSDYGEEIPKAIKGCDAFVLLLSSNSQRSRWVPKELDFAITYGKTVLPFQIDDDEILDTFNFRLSNVQRIEAYGRITEAYEDLIQAIYRVLGISNTEIINPEKPANVIFESSFSKRKGQIFMRSFESKSEEDMITYHFTEEKWNVFVDYIKELTAIMNHTEKDSVKVTPCNQFGEYSCAPVDNQRYWNGPGQFNFNILFIGAGEKKGYDSYYLDFKAHKVELTLYYKGQDVFQNLPEDTELSYFEIEEQKLLEVVKQFVCFMNNESEIKIENKFKTKVHPDKSRRYILEYL